MSDIKYTFPHEVAAQQRRAQTQNDLAQARAFPQSRLQKAPTPPMIINDPWRRNAGWSDDEAALAFSQVRNRADEAFQLHNTRAPAHFADETMDRYRRRLLQNLKHYADDQAIRQTDMSKLPGTSLSAFESLVIDRTVQRFKAPTGPLRMATTIDDAGRPIRRYYGDPAECWDRFKPPMRKFATGMHTANGARAPGAVFQVGAVMSDGSVR